MHILRHLLDRFDYTTDPEFFRRKLEDHRHFSSLVCMLFAVVGVAMWAFDHVTDPVGARDTWVLRLGYLLVFVCAFAIRRISSYRVLGGVMLVSALLAEALFLRILTHLDTGLVYGIGGFMYLQFLPLVIFQGFSLPFNLVCTLALTVVPPLLAWAGLAPGFQYAQYSVLLVPAAALVMLLACASSWSYRQRYLTERALERASNTDPLTGVGNRRHFESILLHELRAGQRLGYPVSLLMLDIDHFKAINDVHGHPTGDRVIRALADVCAGLSRDIDHVARLGGEEFAVLLPAADAAGAQAVAERIRAKVQGTEVHSVAGQSLSWTVSIGVATTEPRATREGPRGQGAPLVDEADAALYDAKRRGRNRVAVRGRPVFTPVRMTMAAEIRAA